MKKFIYVVLVLLAAFFGIFSGTFVNENVAKKTLETQGFSDIKIVDKDIFFVGLKGGAQDDVVKFTAMAKNPIGRTVQVFVFSGWPFKGATIRSD